jgi:hypothetical protein
MENKRQRVPKRQSKIDNLEKLATHGTQDEEKTKQVVIIRYYFRVETMFGCLCLRLFVR